MPNGDLEYIEQDVYEGKKIGKSEKEDVYSEIEYRKNSVVYFVLGAICPYNVMNGYMKRIWRKFGIDKVHLLRNGLCMVKLKKEGANKRIMKSRVYHFDGIPLIIKPWSMQAQYINKQAVSVPVWVRLLALDLKFWKLRTLSKIAKLLGKPIRADPFTVEKMRITYAKILTEIKVKGFV